MKLSEDVYFAGSDVEQNNAFDSRPEQLLNATADMDRVIVFHRGELRESGTHQELLALHGIYYRLYQLQYKDQEFDGREQLIP